MPIHTKCYTRSGHVGRINNTAFSPDGQHLTTAGSDHIVYIWDVATGEIEQRMDKHRSSVLRVAFSPDASIVASGSEDGSVILWNAKTGEFIREVTDNSGPDDESGAPISALTFSLDGRFLLSGFTSQRLLLRDTATDEIVHTFEGGNDVMQRWRSAQMVSFSLSDAVTIPCSCGISRRVRKVVG